MKEGDAEIQRQKNCHVKLPALVILIATPELLLPVNCKERLQHSTEGSVDRFWNESLITIEFTGYVRLTSMSGN
jgi:hypothetical protein